MDITEFEAEKLALNHLLNRLLKRAQKWKTGVEKELEQCLKWEEVHHEAELIQSHLYCIKKGMKEALIPDWNDDNKEKRIPLDPLTEPHEQVGILFKKSKKLRKGIPHWQQQLEKAEQETQKYAEFLVRLSTIQSIESLTELKEQLPTQTAKPPGTTKPLEKLPYREFMTEAGMKLWVGKSAKDNEILTFRYARGLDWWLHVQDFPGSHVILRAAKDQKPDAESLQDALQAALFYSKAKDQGQAEVCLTQCKYVSRQGQKKKGQVYISKREVMHVKWNPVRWKQLVDRSK